MWWGVRLSEISLYRVIPVGGLEGSSKQITPVIWRTVEKINRLLEVNVMG